MINVYIVNLGKYNKGINQGKWLELPCENIEEELASIDVVNGTAFEEYAIHDFEVDIDVKIKKDMSLECLNDLARTLEGLDDCDKNQLNAFLEAYGTSNIDYAIESFETDTAIFYDDCTLEEVAEQIVDEDSTIPEWIKNYIDYSSFAKDLSIDGYFETAYGVIVLA